MTLGGDTEILPFPLSGLPAHREPTAFSTQVPSRMLCLSAGLEIPKSGDHGLKRLKSWIKTNPPFFELDPLRFATEMRQSITVPHSFGKPFHSPSNNRGWGTTRRGAMTRT